MEFFNTQQLFCPDCQGQLTPQFCLEERDGRLVHGVLRCGCSRYPVTFGVINLGGKYRFGLKEAVEALTAGDFMSACAVQMELESFNLRSRWNFLRKGAQRGWPLFTSLLGIFRRRRASGALRAQSFAGALTAVGAGSFGRYLLHRFALPSCLAAWPYLAVARQGGYGDILDLGCGAGHFAHLLSRMLPRARVTCIDQWFIPLVLASRHLAPDAVLLCHNLARPSPCGRQFDLIFSSDALSYQEKRAQVLTSWLPRLQQDGLLLFPRVDHSWGKGFALTPSSWETLFVSVPHRLLAEDALLEDFMERDGADFDRCRYHAGSRALGLVGGTLPAGGDAPQGICHTLAEFPASWAVHPAWSSFGKMERPGRIRKDWEWIHRFAEAHRLEWQEVIASRTPEELIVPEQALREGRFSGFPDLARCIRQGVAVYSPPGYHEPEDRMPKGG